MADEQHISKDPWLAVNLSCLLPGIGQLYAGAKRLGLLLLLGFMALWLGWLWAVLGPGGDLVLVLCFAAGTAILFVLSLFSAHRCARRANSPAAEQARKQAKDRYLAVFLTRIIPGLGHVYLRRWFVGAVVMGVAIALLPSQKACYDGRT